jgi:hypothetical protein
MCVPTSAPPGLFLQASAPLPQDWLAVIMATLGFALLFALARRRLPAGYLRRQALGVIAVSAALMLSGFALTFLVVLPWDSSLESWYVQQSNLLLDQGCSLIKLNAANAQAMMLRTRLELVGDLAPMGGGGLLLVWGVQYARGKL